MNKEKIKFKKEYAIYVDNYSLLFGLDFMNQLKKLMKITTIHKNIMNKFSGSVTSVILSGDECLSLFAKLNKLKRVTKNIKLFNKFVKMLAQGHAFDNKGMTIIRVR